jgi:hypothetical protein
MNNKKKPRGYWTLEKYKEIAKDCKTKTEFFKKSKSAYSVAFRNGWLNDICSHMEKINKPKEYWTKDICINIAKECETRDEFYNKSHSAYNISKYNKWLDELFPINKYYYHPHGFWNIKENCFTEAKLYNSKSEFRINALGAFRACKKHGWLDEICDVIYSGITISFKRWTKEECQIETNKYNSINKFKRKSTSAYNYALQKNG